MAVGETRHAALVTGLRAALQSSGVQAGEPFPCPYLPGREARQLTVLPRPLGPGVYHALMDLNFRRLGSAFYRPQCDGCRECRMIRVPVAAFRPTRAQRRCARRNADLMVRAERPAPSEEKRLLYKSYLEARHDGQMDGSRSEFRRFLYTSAVETVEITYRARGRIVAVGIADVEPLAMSAVYCYFDPSEEVRSPGVFNVLWMIEECRRRGIPYLYLGYYVRGCGRMSYKADYRPCEILDPERGWLPAA